MAPFIDIRKLRRDMQHADTRPLELFFCVWKIVWGLWLLTTHTFAVNPHLYRYVAQVPEPVYGATWLALGVLQLRALSYNILRWRLRISIVGAWLWITYGGLIWWADHRSAALALYTVMACFKLMTVYWLSPGREEGQR